MTRARLRAHHDDRAARRWSAADGVGPAPFLAHAVTDAVRGELADAGEEDWEYAASSAAALASVGLLGEGEPARRVVLAVDVPGARRVEVEDPTRCEVDTVVPFRWVAAVLADSADAEDTVAAARRAEAAGSPEAAGAARALPGPRARLVGHAGDLGSCWASGPDRTFGDLGVARGA